MAGFWNRSNTQISDLNGKPLIGAKAYFYVGGTTTPLPTYRSYDLGTVNLHPNPVTTDGAGFFPAVFLDEEASFYRVRLTTKSGSLIFDQDGIPIIGPSGGGGGGAVTPVDPDAVLKTGDIKSRYGTGVLSGFVRLNGRSIGSATSGATERANADVQALFEYLWAADTTLAVGGGRGASANADWAANKPLTLPNARGRALIGLDNMGNSAEGVVTAATALGWRGGAQTHTLAVSEMPNHDHGGATGSAGSYFNSLSNIVANLFGTFSFPGGGNAGFTNFTVNIPNHTHTIAAQGGGAAHNNMQPSMAVTLYMKI